MRRITPYEQEIANSLYKPDTPDYHQSLIKRFRKDGNSNTIDTDLFANFISPCAIGLLSPFRVHSDRFIAEQAVRRIGLLLATHKDFNFCRIDESIRAVLNRCFSKSWASCWRHANQTTVKALPFQGEDLVNALTVLSCHNSGYVRVSALSELTKVKPEIALKLGLIRTNDWADTVSEAAIVYVGHCLQGIPEDQLVHYLYTIDQLAKKKRRNLADIDAIIRKRLFSKAGLAALKKVTSEGKQKDARIAFHMLENHLEVDELLSVAKANSDTVIRASALRLATTQVSPELRATALIDFSYDRYSPIAKKALYALAEEFPSQARPILISHIAHVNKGIRGICRFYLKKSGLNNADFIDQYALKLDSSKPNELAGTALGLSEVGSREHWPLIQCLPVKSSSVLQGAIVKAAANLNCVPHQWFEEKLLTGTLTQAREASKFLAVNEDYQASQLLSLVQSAGEKERLRYIFSIANHKDKWSYLCVLLCAYSMHSSSDSIAQLIDFHLSTWYRRHNQAYWFVKPPQGQLDDLGDQLVGARKRRDTETLERIERFILSVQASQV